MFSAHKCLSGPVKKLFGVLTARLRAAAELNAYSSLQELVEFTAGEIVAHSREEALHVERLAHWVTWFTEKILSMRMAWSSGWKRHGILSSSVRVRGSGSAKMD